MAFMRPVIEFGEYYSVDTTAGAEIIPADLLNRPVTIDVGQSIDVEHPAYTGLCNALRDFCEGEIQGDIDYRRGHLARMSAPGYMDCTNWTAHETEEEAREYLEEYYGDGD